jgi:hypothetical protein
MKELKPAFETDPHLESLRQEIFELKLAEELLDENITHHFAQVDPQELTYDDLAMYELITRYPEKGELTLESFDQARKPVFHDGNWSRKEFWGYLGNMVLPIVNAEQMEAFRRKKQKAADSLEENLEAK